MRKFGFLIAILFIALAGNINAQTDYGIEIAGIKVTSDNCNFITGEGVSGQVIYNHETKTLLLQYATVEGDIKFDKTKVEDITITLIGQSSVTGSIQSVKGTKTIKGKENLDGFGSLKVGYLNGQDEQNTIIEDCTIDIDATGLNGAMFGIASKLTVKHANISAVANRWAIGYFRDIELIDCEIVEPANAQIIDNAVGTFDGKFICDEDGTVATKVVIKNTALSYGIEIAGVKVTSDNCNNITGEQIMGSVTYNPETKTLTLDNATIERDIRFRDVEDIAITLVGEDTIVGTIHSVTGTKTIKGTGSLIMNSISCIHEKNTIIEDCSITLFGYGWALYSDYDGSKLTIKNANLSVEARNVAIGDFADIELIGCEIVEPANAQIIDNEIEDGYGGFLKGKYICDADGNIAKKVVIKKLSGLNDIAQTNSISIYPNPATNEIVISNIANNEIVEIFDITGKLVKQVVYNNKINVADLQAGVYTIKVNNQIQKLVIE